MGKAPIYVECDGEGVLVFHPFMIEGKNSFKWPMTVAWYCIGSRGGRFMCHPWVKVGKPKHIDKFNNGDIDRVSEREVI